MSRTMLASLLVWGVVAATQAEAPQLALPPVELLAAPVPLSAANLQAVLDATAELLVDKSFMMYGGFGGGTATVGRGPRVRSMHYGDRASEWTGMPARFCNGASAEGELVLDWQVDETGWHATATAQTGPRVLDAMFALWHQAAELVVDLGFEEHGGVLLRGLRYAYEPPAGAQFQASMQSLWFDPRTGLPVRYEIAIEGPEAIGYGYFFAHAPGWESLPGMSAERPDCLSRPAR